MTARRSALPHSLKHSFDITFVQRKKFRVNLMTDAYVSEVAQKIFPSHPKSGKNVVSRLFYLLKLLFTKIAHPLQFLNPNLVAVVCLFDSILVR